MYKLKEKQIEEEYKKYGTFIWLLYNVGNVLDLGITDENLTKLIFISTYMSYQNNRLMLDNKHSMTKSDMQDLLNISDMTFWRFYNSLIETNILREMDECLYLNPEVFARGEIAKINNENQDIYKMRLYVKSIRYLYQKARVREHSLLAYLFQAIPFVNIDYNVICHNPAETDIDHIKPMQFQDYCKLINYNPDNARRLKTKIKALRLEGYPVFNFVDNANGLFCYVNPNVFYAGNNFKEVRILGKFCDKE